MEIRRGKDRLGKDQREEKDRSPQSIPVFKLTHAPNHELSNRFSYHAADEIPVYLHTKCRKQIFIGQVKNYD